MSFLDEFYRRVPSLFHIGLTFLSVPYVLLAAFFIAVGRVATQRGPWAILDTFLTSLNMALTWGILGLVVALLTLCAFGFFEPLRWWGALLLAIIMLVTLGILLLYRPTVPSLGELVFLSPALGILMACCWRVVLYR